MVFCMGDFCEYLEGQRNNEYRDEIVICAFCRHFSLSVHVLYCDEQYRWLAEYAPPNVSSPCSACYLAYSPGLLHYTGLRQPIITGYSDSDDSHEMPESDSDDEEETDKDNKEDDDSSVGYSEDEEDDDTIGTALLEEEAVHSHKLTVHEPCHHVLMPLVNKHNLVTEKDNKDGWVYCAAEDEHSPCGADTILFSGKPGLTNLQMGKKPEDFFNTLWDASMWDCICDSTKEEAEAQRGSADIIVCTDKMPKLLKKHA